MASFICRDVELLEVKSGRSMGCKFGRGEGGGDSCRRPVEEVPLF